MTIRALKNSDYKNWLPLWQENCEHKIADEVTAETWRRICNTKENVFGLGAFEDDRLIGILHYILHPTTGQKELVCYMQDLFVHKDHRRKGFARRLVWELNEIGKTQNWARIYWLADRRNEVAQNLYKTLGIPVDFSLHIMPVKHT